MPRDWATRGVADLAVLEGGMVPRSEEVGAATRSGGGVAPGSERGVVFGSEGGGGGGSGGLEAAPVSDSCGDMVENLSLVAVSEWEEAVATAAGVGVVRRAVVGPWRAEEEEWEEEGGVGLKWLFS